MKSQKRYTIAFDDYISSSVKWTRHRRWEKGQVRAHPDERLIYLYMIVGTFGRTRRVLYIGKTYKQTASYRLSQPDHVKRWRTLKRSYPRHKLTVSFGIPSIAEYNCTEKRIDEIESILLYANSDDRYLNAKKVFSITSKFHLHVRNTGYFKPLKKECYFGTVFR